MEEVDGPLISEWVDRIRCEGCDGLLGLCCWAGSKARQALLTLEQASEPGLDDDLARGGWLVQPSLSPGHKSWNQR